MGVVPHTRPLLFGPFSPVFLRAGKKSNVWPVRSCDRLIALGGREGGRETNSMAFLPETRSGQVESVQVPQQPICSWGGLATSQSVNQTKSALPLIPAPYLSSSSDKLSERPLLTQDIS